MGAMKDFTTAFTALNAAQRRAVETIEGPVLVVAGPGTGKTQLLGMRAAHIVRQTDTLPTNILCLTFTESAAAAMRQRLISLMGSEGNKVAVHTFHSFGTDIINRYPEHFYNGASFAPADELTSYEILRDIFESLPHNSPLAKTMNGEFTSLKGAKAAISHLKRAGLLPEELLAILDHNKVFCDYIEPELDDVFTKRLSKKDLPALHRVVESMSDYTPKPAPFTFIKPLHELCTQELSHALDEATETGKTTPITAWRNRWLEKNHLGKFVFKDRKQTKKLQALTHIYQKYREALLEQALFDFDDMVSLVAHTLEIVPELRLNLQEQYLYIMVDEFQDTNGAQDRLLRTLTDNPVHEGRPNILAVGDDDQAIYSFQGAELSNILEFAARYKDTHIITLTDNYRSTATILTHARQVITQGESRLEHTLKDVRKELTAHNTTVKTGSELHISKTGDGELHWTATQISQRIKRGLPPREIAVLARHHRQLIALLPHLHAAGIPVNYERRNNVLESPHIIELITMAEAITALGEQRYDVADSLLPELLSYDFWGIKTEDLWRLSINAYKQRRMWLELMIEAQGQLRHIAEFIIVASHQAMHEPLETMLDIMLGTDEQQAPTSDTDADMSFTKPESMLEDFHSPYRDFYFSKTQLDKNPTNYITLLSNVRAIRRAVTAYRPSSTLSLRDFVDFVDLCERTNTPVIDAAITYEAMQGVQLMTAHKSKGLEFDTVFVLSCQDDIWGRKARHPRNALSFPRNLPIEPAGTNYDDALRLFFVAMTRAKHHLILTAHQTDITGKEVVLAEFLQDTLEPTLSDTEAPRLEELVPGWEARHLTLPQASQQALLQPVLENYQLSATHLHNFLDVTRGGPQTFLLQNLLRFPQAVTPGQAFGHAIHAVVARAHTHLSATGEKRPIEDILHDYELQLQNVRLSERDFNFLLEKGGEILHTFLAARYESFVPEQKAERGFSTQNVRIGDVHVTGAIDLLDVDKQAKTLIVTDYKTGKCHADWKAKTDYERIKLHKYKQQLMFYKLLAENSRDFMGYTVTKGVLEFIEPDDNKQCHQLELMFDMNDLTEFKQLLTAVWEHIKRLDFPDTSKYDATFNGILAFERDLKEGKI